MTRSLTAACVGCAAAAVVAATAWTARSQNPAAAPAPGPAENTAKATGVGRVVVAPDRVRVYFAVATTELLVRDARAANAAATGKVMDAVRKLNIDGLKSSTRDLSVHEVRGRQPDTEGKLLGYRVSHYLSVTVASKDRAKLNEFASAVSDAVMENGGTDVGLEFQSTEGADAQKKALAAAARNAADNLAQMVSGINGTVTAVTAVDQAVDWGRFDTGNNFNSIQANPIAPAAGADTVVNAGDLVVTAQVTATGRYVVAK